MSATLSDIKALPEFNSLSFPEQDEIESNYFQLKSEEASAAPSFDGINSLLKEQSDYYMDKAASEYKFAYPEDKEFNEAKANELPRVKDFYTKAQDYSSKLQYNKTSTPELFKAPDMEDTDRDLGIVPYISHDGKKGMTIQYPDKSMESVNGIENKAQLTEFLKTKRADKFKGKREGVVDGALQSLGIADNELDGLVDQINQESSGLEGAGNAIYKTANSWIDSERLSNIIAKKQEKRLSFDEDNEFNPNTDRLVSDPFNLDPKNQSKDILKDVPKEEIAAEIKTFLEGVKTTNKIGGTRGLAKYERYRQSLPESERGNLSTFTSYFANNKGEFFPWLANIAASAIPDVVATTGTALAAGSVSGPAGAFTAGATIGTYREYTATLLSEVQDRAAKENRELTPQLMNEYLDDIAFIEQIETLAGKRAVVTGIAEGVAAGAIQKVIGSAIKGVYKKALVAGTIDIASGGVGEYYARKYAGQEADATEVISEMAGGMSVVPVAAVAAKIESNQNKVQEAKAKKVEEIKAAVTTRQQQSNAETATDLQRRADEMKVGTTPDLAPTVGITPPVAPPAETPQLTEDTPASQVTDAFEGQVETPLVGKTQDGLTGQAIKRPFAGQVEDSGFGPASQLTENVTAPQVNESPTITPVEQEAVTSIAPESEAVAAPQVIEPSVIPKIPKKRIKAVPKKKESTPAEDPQLTEPVAELPPVYEATPEQKEQINEAAQDTNVDIVTRKSADRNHFVRGFKAEFPDGSTKLVPIPQISYNEYDTKEEAIQAAKEFIKTNPDVSSIEKWADDTIRESKTRVTSGVPDPTLLAAYAIKGSILIGKGITNFAEWSARMLAEFGEAIKPYLKSIFDKSNESQAKKDTQLTESKDKLDNLPASKRMNSLFKEEGDIRDRGRIYLNDGAESKWSSLPEINKIIKKTRSIPDTNTGEDYTYISTSDLDVLKALQDAGMVKLSTIQEGDSDRLVEISNEIRSAASEMRESPEYSNYEKAKTEERNREKLSANKKRTLKVSSDKKWDVSPPARITPSEDQSNESIRASQFKSPSHSVDSIEVVEEILNYGLNSGSALDETSDKGFSEYGISLIVPHARRGEEIEHNGYYESRGVSAVGRVIIDSSNINIPINEVRDLAAKHPDVKFEIINDDGTIVEISSVSQLTEETAGITHTPGAVSQATKDLADAAETAQEQQIAEDEVAKEVRNNAYSRLRAAHLDIPDGLTLEEARDFVDEKLTDAEIDLPDVTEEDREKTIAAISELRRNVIIAISRIPEVTSSDKMTENQVTLVLKTLQRVMDIAENPAGVSYRRLQSYNNAVEGFAESDSLAGMKNTIRRVFIHSWKEKLAEATKSGAKFTKPIHITRNSLMFGLFGKGLGTTASVAEEIAAMARNDDGQQFISDLMGIFRDQADVTQLETTAMKEEWYDVVDKNIPKATRATQELFYSVIGAVARITQWDVNSTASPIDQMQDRLTQLTESMLPANLSAKGREGSMYAVSPQDVATAQAALAKVFRGGPIDIQALAKTIGGDENAVAAYLEGSLSPGEKAILDKTRSQAARYLPFLKNVKAITKAKSLQEWNNYVHDSNRSLIVELPEDVTTKSQKTELQVMHDRTGIDPKDAYPDLDIRSMMESQAMAVAYEKNTGIERYMFSELMNDKDFASALDNHRGIQGTSERIKAVAKTYHDSMTSPQAQFKPIGKFIEGVGGIVSSALTMGVSSGVANLVSSAVLRSGLSSLSRDALGDSFVYDANSKEIKQWLKTHVPTQFKRTSSYDVFEGQDDRYGLVHTYQLNKDLGTAFKLAMGRSTAQLLPAAMHTLQEKILSKISNLSNALPERYNAFSIFTAAYIHYAKKNGSIVDTADFLDLINNPARSNQVDKRAATDASDFVSRLMGYAPDKQDKGSAWNGKTLQKKAVARTFLLFAQQPIGQTAAAQNAFLRASRNLKDGNFKEMTKQLSIAASAVTSAITFVAIKSVMNTWVAWPSAVALAAYIGSDDEEEKRRIIKEQIQKTKDISNIANTGRFLKEGAGKLNPFYSSALAFNTLFNIGMESTGTIITSGEAGSLFKMYNKEELRQLEEIATGQIKILEASVKIMEDSNQAVPQSMIDNLEQMKKFKKDAAIKSGFSYMGKKPELMGDSSGMAGIMGNAAYDWWKEYTDKSDVTDEEKVAIKRELDTQFAYNDPIAGTWMTAGGWVNPINAVRAFTPSTMLRDEKNRIPTVPMLLTALKGQLNVSNVLDKSRKELATMYVKKQMEIQKMVQEINEAANITIPESIPLYRVNEAGELEEIKHKDD